MKVGLFVTCLVDLARPGIGFATLKLLESAGCEVVVPAGQTCCGQPGYNSGAREISKDLARKVLAEFRDCDYVVAPSGSCTGQVRVHYVKDLFAGEPEEGEFAKLAAKWYELSEFLVQVLKVESVPGRFGEHRHVPRQLLGPSRAGREGAAAPPPRHSRRAHRRDGRVPRSAAASAAPSPSSSATSPRAWR